MSGPQENLRVLQSYEAEYAKRVAFAEEGFRDPKVLAGDLAMANFSFGGLGWIRFFSISVLSLYIDILYKYTQTDSIYCKYTVYTCVFQSI